MIKRKSIFFYAKHGEIEKVKSCINIGIDKNAFDNDGYTPIHLAAANGHIKLMDYLIKVGVNINAHTNLNYTPLELACVYNQLESVKFLIKSGCDLNDDYCNACIYCAARNHYEILKFLLKNGANVNQCDYSNMTALHWAAQEGYINIVKLLDGFNADLNSMDDEGMTPLYISSSENHIEIVKYLLQRKAVVDLGGNATPFMIACAFKYYEVAEVLLRAGADINYKDSDGRTALFYAKVKSNKKLQEFLLQRDAETNIVDHTGISMKDLDNEDVRRQLYNELF